MSEPAPQRSGFSAVVLRRKWVVLPTVVIVPVVAVALSFLQRPRYAATAQVLVNTDSPAERYLAGPGSPEDPARFAQTQARLARAPAVVRGVLARSDLRDRTVEEFLKASEVTSDPNDDLLNFRVSDRDPSLAMRLATDYARRFASYRNRLDSQQIARVRDLTDRRLASLRRSGGTSSSRYRTLEAQARQLALLEATQRNYIVTTVPFHASQISPRPGRTALLGLLVGGTAALGLVLLVERLDRRVYSTDEISGTLGLPLLSSLRTPTREDRRLPVVMLAHPDGEAAQRFRVLEMNLRFLNIEVGARSIMFTSALKDEGKSTTVANVAVALARAGNHIALVDLDLRRPRIHELFGLDSDRGVTQVAMYKLELEDALQPVSLVSPNAATPPATAANPRLGVLDVLACGPRPPDVGDFLAQPRLNTLLRSLPRLYDLTLIDAPPMLGVSDAVAVGSKVDAIVVVSRVRELTQGALRDLAAALRASPASKLGLVITAAELDVDHRENYYRGYYASTRHTNHREEEWPPA